MKDHLGLMVKGLLKPEEMLPMDLVSFWLDDYCYALELQGVRQSFRAVAPHPLPEGPSSITGIVNVHGQAIPVVNLRSKLNLPPRNLAPEDSLIWVEAASQDLLLAVDRMGEVLQVPDEQIVDVAQMPDDVELFKGIVSLEEGILFIPDLGRLLDIREREILQHAMGS
ncbi:hypothetical protein EZI54_06310 [Marinobacter halodurans]|uniref:CheW-like domain-containing protein n=1 Tax=Marinobacter halodurans TaxID=2528979 RepID=A0ABY1ZRV6_9GAMM|nr:chemotaxis protein CheW [Marinobacter halodurans]TBW57648.1 hypothetical protein EZI54_06310 [Marinobacter halodurans]